MIKIEKTDRIPEILTSDKTLKARQEIEKKIQNDPKSVRSADFKSNIYNGDGVKAQLRQDQYNKCAYCEVSLVGDYACVEHYRPKTGYKNEESDSLKTPGYYWLAYEWTNLLCSCDKCNGPAYKGNLFPLRNDGDRGIDNQDISKEVPLIINPTLEDPGQFLRFKEYLAVPSTIEGKESDKGRNTIDIFDLNGHIRKNKTPARMDLKNARMIKWEKVKAVYKKFRSLGVNRDDAINIVKELYAKQEYEYSGMFTNQDTWFK